jgi:uncharacterized membrane protein
MSDIFKKIRRHFLEGLIALLPITLTIVIIYFLFNFIYQQFDFLIPLLPKEIRGIFFFDFLVVILTIMMSFILITLVGLAANTFIGKALEKIVENTFISLPGVKMLYKSFKQLFSMVFKNTDQKFSKAVLIEYPSKGLFSIAFLTGKCSSKLSPDTKKEFYTVFMPTTPNPTTGFLVIVPKESIREIDIPIDDAMKMILSGGILKN